MTITISFTMSITYIIYIILRLVCNFKLGQLLLMVTVILGLRVKLNLTY